MEFGKVSSTQKLNFISFDLPNEDDRSYPLLQRRAKPKVYVGFPVWSHKRWLNQLYPKGAVPRDYLFHYSQQIQTIELNSTFYQIPKAEQVLGWSQSVPPDFKFCPKVFQEISRFQVLGNIPTLLTDFCQSVSQFGSHLGPAFMQLPPDFGPEKLLILKRFFKLLPPQFKLAVEFRHPGWFKDGYLVDTIFQLLVENGISTVITDVAGRREILHTSLTTNTVLVRFVGNSLHPTDLMRLDDWINLLGKWIQQGIHEIYFFIHQPEQVGALELLLRFISQMNKHYDLNLQSWDPHRINPQQSLFLS